MFRHKRVTIVHYTHFSEDSSYQYHVNLAASGCAYKKQTLAISFSQKDYKVYNRESKIQNMLWLFVRLV